MKCESVACVWSGVPSLHGRVTASAVLNDPPTLYTGGSDGSIIWWHLSSNQSNQCQKIWPMAVLCGHTAAIADLEICLPIVDHVEREGTISNVKSIPAGSGAALISACVDGVLCIWSRGSGHCKRRRKLPPWVGTPAMMSSLPMSPRYVCIGCNCVDTSNSHAADGSAAASQEANGSQISNEAVLYRDGAHSRRTSNCAAIIVDSCTLNILQTIYHGSLFLGRLKFMAAVPFDKEKQLVIMADTLAKVESFVLIKEIDGPLNEGTNAVQKRPLMETSIEADSVHDRGVEAISVSRDGKLLAFIFRTRCIFWHMTSGIAIGEISSMDTPFLKEEGPAQGAYIKGGTFLQSDYGGCVPGAEHHNEGFLETFAVWSNKGSVIIYTVSGSSDTFHFETSCEIPAISHQNVVKLSVSFIQLNTYLLRVESICFDVEGLLLWKPNVSIWSLGQSPMLMPDVVGKLGTQSKVRRSKSSNNPGDPDLCIMLGEGGFLCDWIQSSFSPFKADENSNSRSCVAGLKHGDCLLSKQQIVSSSLILSNDFDAPYAVVYGFFSGQIEVVRFGMFFNKLSSVDGGNLHHNVIHPHQCEQYFSGHTGAILCLAAHRMVGASGDEGAFKRVLISGSLDCTICIWDLDTGNLISKMHHHVGPVRQIILAPPCTDRPWNDCFLSVGEDLSVALASLETLRVERMFPGHPSYPELVVWDSARGYIACLCLNVPSSPLLSISSSDTGINVLYIWDVKTGAQERALRGTACRSMFDHFCRGINVNPVTGNILGGTTSASSLALPIMIDDASFSKYHDSKNLEKGDLMHGRGKAVTRVMDFFDFDASLEYHASKEKLPTLKATGHDFTFHPSSHTSVKQLPPKAIFHENEHNLIKCSCPFPGIATLKFNLSSLMHLCQRNKHNSDIQGNTRSPYQGHDTERPTVHFRAKSNDTTAILQGTTSQPVEEHAWDRSLEGCLLQLSLSFLHLWGVDHQLDTLLIDEMNICKPESFIVASGLVGDRGSLTLAFPGQQATLELWKASSEFCAMRALTMVSLAQRVISLSRSSCAASSALAAFYTRNFVEKVPDIKPPLLQLLVSFWQDPSEHVRMAARSLFHCAASRAIPLPLCSPKRMQHELHGCIFTNDVAAQVESSNIGEKSTSNLARTGQDHFQEYESSVLAWLESYEVYDWISCVGGTNQDAMSSHIVVAGALAVWYPSLVKPSLAVVVVHPLLKLVMAMNDKYSATAAELLAEGMESTWKDCIGPEITRLIGDIFFQIECVSSTTSNTCLGNPSLAINIRDTLVGILLPSLAMADIPGFLNVIESQIWANASDSPVHIVSLMTLIRVARGSPKNLALHVDKVLNFILQTMDPANSVMRKTCLNSSMAVLRELMRVFPMIGLNETSTQLAVGDAVGDIRSVTIRVYDMQSATKVKVLDASGPPGLPSLLGGTSETMITTAISALSFSPDGEGLVAFSEQGLMIRWWSLGTAWWEKLSRSYVPVQCTKLIFVPPWEGFSPTTSRSSMMASIIGHHNLVTSEEKMRGLGDADSLKLLINNLDLFYQLEWTGKRKVKLLRHGHELGSFQL